MPVVTPRKTTNIGSFRSTSQVEELLPSDLYHALFDEVTDCQDITQLITVDKSKVYLNNGAFGRAYHEVFKLSTMLREFSESQPDVFYDQVCLPLINRTYQILEKFFNSEKILLVPNCTFAMKCVAEHLIKEKHHSDVAYLYPFYGASQKLLDYYHQEGLINDTVAVSPGENALFEEDPLVITSALQKAYNVKVFSVLFCDEVASQSGRILPLEAISKFCQDRSITLVVDGTQSCQLFFGNKKSVLKNVDYFVMSTHKWLCNVKTCGLICYKDDTGAPNSPNISFGWERSSTKKSIPLEKVRAKFMWQGMMDSYVSFITLGRALQIFSKYGEEQFFKAASLLQTGLTEVLKVKPLLQSSPNTFRVINVFELENSQLEPLKDINKIQNALQDYGIFVSVKKFGVDCAGVTVDGERLPSSPKKNMVSIDVVSRNDYNLAKDNSAISCTKPLTRYYLRVCCWSYNQPDDFETLALVLTNNLRLSTTSKSGLKQQLNFMFDLCEKLFSVLKTKAFFIRAEPLRHHLIFYYGHTAVFYINKLIVSGILHPTQRINPQLESSLSVGVDEMSWDDLLEDNYEWCGLSNEELEAYLQNVRTYRSQVRQLVLKMIDEKPLVNPIVQDSFYWVLLMAIEHEKIHVETSAVIISQVPLDLIKTRHSFNYPTFYHEKRSSNSLHKIADKPNEAPTNRFVQIPGGTVLMGKQHLEKDIYGWDNEYGSETKTLESFKASQMLVSNAEYFEFVKAGGYSEAGQRWWSQEGLKYIKDLGISGPRFWVGQTKYRALLEEIPMPWNFPVEVNNLEAEAFCNWKSETLGERVRLISQEESFHMRQIAKKETSNHNLNKYASVTPVDLYNGIIDDQTVYDISGNVWRHSVSVLTVMNGFKTNPIYNDFTLPTIDGYHNHILGGSWISLGNSANINARYGFRRHFYQYAGIRYVSSTNDYHSRVHKMFDEVLITKQITEHYSNFTSDTLLERKPVPNWPKILGEKAASVVKENLSGDDETINIMVAYGGVGRTTLEILRHCQNVKIDHTDMTANNLQVLRYLLQESGLQWYQQIEGDITELMEYHLQPNEKDGLLLDTKKNAIFYWQADYTNLRAQLSDYSVVVADFREKEKADELKHISTRLRLGGLLILGSIDDVDLSHSPGSAHSLSVLHKYFHRVEHDDQSEFPHIFRETRNKHQYAVSHFSVWKKVMKITGDDEAIEKSNSDSSMKAIPTATSDYYEDNKILNSYDQFHYGNGLISIKNFPLRISEVCIEACRKFNTKFDAALDAGCGPGRTAIELCSVFKKVEAYDYSQSFVNMLLEKKLQKTISNLTAYQGDSHKQDDICQQKKFNLITACNLIDRLHTPREWVLKSKSMLTDDGLLIISSPYTWKPEHTKPSEWLGGFRKNGESHFTVNGLTELLMPELLLLEELKIPFVIPDADGTYQYTYSNCTIYGRPRK